MRVLVPRKTRRAYPDADKQDEDRRSKQPEERAEAARECTKTYMTHRTVTATKGCDAYTIIIASPKEKNRYPSPTATRYALSISSREQSAETSMRRVLSGRWKLVMSASTHLKR